MATQKKKRMTPRNRAEEAFRFFMGKELAHRQEKGTNS